MNIHLACGTGVGPTKMAAFDAALNAAGVANFNLIRLSSIIPPKSKVINYDGPIDQSLGKWGDKLYVVMAEMRVDTPNAEAWAGIGWVMDKKTGMGLFVEHEGLSETTVRKDITQSLQALMKTRNVDFGPIEMKVIGKTCTHEPVCALVVASYQSRGWASSLRLG